MSVGAIHDLGYKRYLGTRRPQSTRWRVIVRNQVSTAWKTWWRYKLALGWAVVTFLSVLGVILFMYQNAAFLEPVMKRVGFKGNAYDFLIALFSIQGFCRAAFLAGLTGAAGAIAADAQVGAFTFYFARPVRPMDYVLGKLGGLFLLMSFLITVPLFALTCVRVGLSTDTDAMIAALPRLGSALLTGTLGALLFAALPLAISSMIAKRSYAIGAWAVWYILIGGIFQGLAFATRTPALAAVDPLSAIQGVGQGFYEVSVSQKITRDQVPFTWALALTLVMIAGSIAVAFWQVSRRAHAGVGGS